MRFAQLAQVAFIVMAGIAVYSFVGAAKDGERRRSCTSICALRPDYAGNNRTAPDFELTDIDGRPFRLSDARGKVVILNFWTKTCRPCLEEMPTVVELGKILQKRSDKIVLATVSTDENAEDVRNTLSAILEGEQPSFLALVDGENKVVADKFGTKLYPETWFIDTEGVIRARFDGPRDWSDSMFLDLAESLLHPEPCAAAFEKGRPTASTAPLCADLPLAAGL